MSIVIQPVAQALGAEISNIDLSKQLTNTEASAVHDALLQYQVLFFRDQDINPAQLSRFARLFGEPLVHPFIKNNPEFPEISLIEHNEKKPPTENHWHTDVSFAVEPAMGSILSAKKIPPTGGDTMWANMYAAYDALSGSMQSFLSGLTAIHDFMMAFGPSVSRLQKNPEALVRKQQENPPAEHPVIRTHPETGKKGIYVNSAFTSHIVGMKKEESKAILNFLYQHVATPEFSCRFKWTQNTVAFWDNRCTQHYAHADYFPHQRNMHRIALKGEKPS